MLALVAAGAAIAGPAAPGKQRATTPCWKVLTNDAFDGKVDGIYPVAVYGEAIDHLPTDVQSYSTIADVITRARQDALQQAGKGVKPDPARCGFALGSSGGSGGGTSTTAGGGGGGKGPIPGVIESVGSDNAESFPVALIAIAAVAGVLVFGGAAGFLLRRQQRRRSEFDAASGPGGGGLDPATGPPELNP